MLAAANIMNNRLARRWAPLTSSATTGALVALARGSGLSWRELGFEQGRRGAAAGGVLALGVAAVYGAGVLLPRTRPLFHDERALSLSRARLLEETLLQVPVGTVLLEEAGFRGALYGMLRRRYGAAGAAVLSSGLFGLWHVLPAIDLARSNPVLAAATSGEAGRERPHAAPVEITRIVGGSVLSTTAAGLFFCELRRRRGLLPPALLHVATNSLGYLFARLAGAGKPGGGERAQAVETTWKPSA